MNSQMKYQRQVLRDPEVKKLAYKVYDNTDEMI